MADGKIPEEFEVGTPVLVCRWRLQDGTLPIENRHLRALGRRHVLGKKLSRQLLAWAKQHIEWTLADGTAEHPDGVLMLFVDAEGRAAMACGDYEPLPDTTLAGLLARAASGSDEASETDIAPETIWVGRGRGLAVGMAPGEHPSGAASLVEDLAKTLGMPVERDPQLLARLADAAEKPAEAFLVSDEHGIIPASDASGALARKFADGWDRLLERSRRR